MVARYLGFSAIGLHAMNNRISIKQAFSFGWRSLKINVGFFIKFFLFGGLLLVVSAFLSQSFLSKETYNTFYPIIRTLIQDFLIIVGTIALLSIADQGKTTLMGSIRAFRFRQLINLIVATFLISLLTMIGLLLFVIPGILIFITLSQTLQVVVDQRLNFWSAMKESARLTKGSKMRILLFFVLVGLTNLLGLSVLGVGLFIAIPLTSLASTSIYLQLKAKSY